MNLGFGQSIETIMLSAIVFLLISALFGFIGMIAMYSLSEYIIPVMVGVDKELVDKTKDMSGYKNLQDGISITGWVFGVMPMIFWWYIIRKELNDEVKLQSFTSVEEIVK